MGAGAVRPGRLLPPRAPRRDHFRTSVTAAARVRRRGARARRPGGRRARPARPVRRRGPRRRAAASCCTRCPTCRPGGGSPRSSAAPDPRAGLRWLPEVPRADRAAVRQRVARRGAARRRRGRPAGAGRRRTARERPGPPRRPRSCWPGARAGGRQGRAEVGLSPRPRLGRRGAPGPARARGRGRLRPPAPATRRPTLTGYRAGRQVPPVPDGVLRPDRARGARQRARRPPAPGWSASARRCARSGSRVAAGLDRRRARRTPRGWPRAGAAAELLDPAGLGGFGWLVAGGRDRPTRSPGACSMGA